MLRLVRCGDREEIEGDEPDGLMSEEGLSWEEVPIMV
jgi:hypothetical protein